MSARFVYILNSGGITMIRDYGLSSRFTKFTLVVILLNIRGIPPLTGFIIKLTLLKSIVGLYYPYVVLLLVASVLIIYIYVSISYYLNRFKSHSNNSNDYFNIKAGILILSVATTPLISFVFLI